MHETGNNADTCVMVNIFLLMKTTGRVAEVYGFRTNDRPDQIHIGSGITAVNHPEHGTILFMVHEGLWYGPRMDHSLINPNQVRANKTPYWDNTFDTERGIKISIYDNVDIPLLTRLS